MYNPTCKLPQPYNKIGDGPEGPEVYVMSTNFKKYCNGHKLLQIYSMSPRYDSGGPNEIPAEFINKLPLVVRDVTSHGKKTIVHLSKNAALLISYGMTGGWRYDPSDYAQIEFKFSGNKYYYWTCSRSLPTAQVQFLTTDQLSAEISKLGFDICRDQPTNTEILRVYFNTSKNICSFLMDQKYFAGIGNYVKAVILYRCKISPHIKVNKLSDTQKLHIWTTAQQVAQQAIAANGMGMRDYKDEHGNVVGVDFDVTPYNCQEDLDGNPVVCEKTSDGRMTWWVPNVQI